MISRKIIDGHISSLDISYLDIVLKVQKFEYFKILNENAVLFILHNRISTRKRRVLKSRFCAFLDLPRNTPRQEQLDAANRGSVYIFGHTGSRSQDGMCSSSLTFFTPIFPHFSPFPSSCLLTNFILSAFHNLSQLDTLPKTKPKILQDSKKWEVEDPISNLTQVNNFPRQESFYMKLD